MNKVDSVQDGTSQPTNPVMPQMLVAIEVDAGRVEIGDLKVLALFEALPPNATDEEIAQRKRDLVKNMPAMVDFLERVVVGGIKGIPLTQLGEVMTAVNAAMARAMEGKSGAA